MKHISHSCKYKLQSTGKWPALRPTLNPTRWHPSQTGDCPHKKKDKIRPHTQANNESSWARDEDGHQRVSHTYPTGGRCAKSPVCRNNLIKSPGYAVATTRNQISTFRAFLKRLKIHPKQMNPPSLNSYIYGVHCFDPKFSQFSCTQENWTCDSFPRVGKLNSVHNNLPKHHAHAPEIT